MIYSDWLNGKVYGGGDISDDDEKSMKKNKGGREGGNDEGYLVKQYAQMSFGRAKCKTVELLGVKQQACRNVRYLYTNRVGCECRLEMVRHFERPSTASLNSRTWHLDGLVCEIMQMRFASLQRDEPRFHVKFWLPTCPLGVAWITLPFQSENFPDLPADFAIGQMYGMVLELEDIGKGNGIFRVRNHNRTNQFDEVFIRRSSGELKPDEMLTFSFPTPSGDMIETVQFLDGRCSRSSTDCGINMNGYTFDLVKTTRGLALAVRDDRLFDDFPALVPDRTQLFSAVLEPLPNGRMVLQQGNVSSLNVDWRVTNLLIDSKAIVKGPKYIGLDTLPRGLDSAPKFEPSNNWKLSVCVPASSKKTKIVFKETVKETYEDIRNIYVAIRKHHDELRFLKNYNSKELIRICRFLEEHEYVHGNLFASLYWLYNLIKDENDFEIVKRVGKFAPSLAYCIVENLHCRKGAFLTFLPIREFSPINIRLNKMCDSIPPPISTSILKRSHTKNCLKPPNYRFLDFCQPED